MLGVEEAIPLKGKANECVEIEKWMCCSVKGSDNDMDYICKGEVNETIQ